MIMNSKISLIPISKNWIGTGGVYKKIALTKTS
jgi:hypothetical protein